MCLKLGHSWCWVFSSSFMVKQTNILSCHHYCQPSNQRFLENVCEIFYFPGIITLYKLLNFGFEWSFLNLTCPREPLTPLNTRFPCAAFHIHEVSTNPIYFPILSFNKYYFLLPSFTYSSIHRSSNTLVPGFICWILY